MGTIETFLCVFLGHFIAVQSVISRQDATFPQDFPGFFENIMPFPFRRNFRVTPYDTIFSSWKNGPPDFHMLADFPPIVNIPRVEVFCDESKLTVLVDKSSNGVILTGEEIQLGDGCYSNRELPNQWVFTYSLDECGTTPVMQHGVERFTNSLHLNLKRPPPTGWQTPSTVHISCLPKRSYSNPNFFDSMAHPESGKTFNIRAMNPSWTSTAESNVYKRGEVVNLQVSARGRPEQQLFIQSCFVSTSPEPQTRNRHAVIMNKGCTAPLGSPHAIMQFVASNRADVVNLVLNTTYLISELYVRCSVLLSDQGVTAGSKSCNYNVIQSRWEDLVGTAEVCECCNSKCKGLSVKHLSEGARAVVTTGPFIILDKGVETSPEPSVSEMQEPTSTPVPGSLQSDGAATEDPNVSGTSISRSEASRPPQGVVVVSEDPVARLTLWLPGQVQDTEHSETGSESEDSLTVELQASNSMSNDLPELQISTMEQASPLNTLTNKIGDQNFDYLPLVEGWIIPPLLEKAAMAEESHRKTWFEAPQEVLILLPDEMTVTSLNHNDFDQMRDDLAQRQADAAAMFQEGRNEAGPIVRSKLLFSKGTDGSQTLSYEEDVVKQHEGKDVIRRLGLDSIKGKQEPRLKGMRSTFVDLLRRMDKAE